METPTPQPAQMQGFAMQGAGAVSGAKMAPDAKRRIYYGIISFILITLSGAMGYLVTGTPVVMYVSLCVAYVLLGTLHLFLIDMLKVFGQDKTFASRLLYTVVIVLFCMIGYFVMFYFLSHKSSFTFYFALSLGYLLVPMAVMRCFDLGLAVPAKQYKEWHYPAKPIIADMERIDLSNFAIITYVFSKKHGDAEKSNFQSKAPYDFKLGDLFYFFIQEWNYKYPQANIEFSDERKDTFGWLFYVQDKWYKKRRYLDPEKTIRDNEILVNQIIQTLRVPQDKRETTA